MSELKITQNSLENAILKDGLFVSGYVADSVSINVSGYGAHAEGYAVGRNITASGNGAHAEGISTLALADGAHAEGYDTSALGYASHAGGIGTIADQEAMTAIGKYNNTSVGYIGGDYLFVVGNGTASSDASRSNAFAVTTKGITATTLNLSAGNYQEESDQDDENRSGEIVWSDGGCYILETIEDQLTIYAQAGLLLKTGGVNNININNNTIVNGDVKAKVNGVSNVYLGCPIGTIVMWPGETVPEGWLLCDGTLLECLVTTGERPQWEYDVVIRRRFPSNGGLPRDWFFRFNNRAYVNLGKVILGVYGITNGEPGGMYLPNFKGLFPIGAGEGTDINGETIEFPLGESNGLGEYKHTLTAGESGLPAHTHAVPTGGATTSGAAAAQKGAEADWDPFSTANAGGVAAQQAHNNIPPYLAINFIIKYK